MNRKYITAVFVLTWCAAAVGCTRARKPVVDNTAVANAATVTGSSTHCLLTAEDVVDSLGQSAKFVAKSDPRLSLTPSEVADPKVDACGYSNDDGAFIFWQSREAVNQSTAGTVYRAAKERLLQNAGKHPSEYWASDVPTIVDGGYMTQGSQWNIFLVDITGRVEKITFQIHSSSPVSKKISYVVLRGLAVGLSRRLPTTPS